MNWFGVGVGESKRWDKSCKGGRKRKTGRLANAEFTCRPEPVGVLPRDPTNPPHTLKIYLNHGRKGDNRAGRDVDGDRVQVDVLEAVFAKKRGWRDNSLVNFCAVPG